MFRCRFGDVTNILGISAFFHDSAAALMIDGELVAAAQEERFSRVKNDASFPSAAIDFCLQSANIAPEELHYVGFFEKPLQKFDRILETHLAFAPQSLGSFLAAMPSWLTGKLRVRGAVRKTLGLRTRRRVVYTQHHLAHAASAFFLSPFDDAAILTVDGVGEWATTTRGIGRGNQIRLSDEIQFPHSIGLLYSAFTAYCGFRVNQDEYKLMGLAAYGHPIYVDTIRTHLIDAREDGSIWIDMRYFDFGRGLRMTSDRFHRLFNRGPRAPDEPIEQLDRDLAASIQHVTESTMLGLAESLYARHPSRNLCLAGGVALNCLANGRILREGPFDDVWIQPAAGDAGGAAGVAAYIWFQLLKHSRSIGPNDRMRGALLGPEYTAAGIDQWLTSVGRKHQRIADRAKLSARIAGDLASGAVVGWFQGRMEFGPRALGNRSILADPRGAETQARINRKIKGRESFRPFAPAVLHEHAASVFHWAPHHRSPYMLIATQAQSTGDQPFAYPAVVHVDRSARLQTVDNTTNSPFRLLLEAFFQQTGCPMLVNTSMNRADEPIVQSPAEALRCFDETEMDILVLEDCIVRKSDPVG
jgi:carbamoyltransferase